MANEIPETAAQFVVPLLVAIVTLLGGIFIAIINQVLTARRERLSKREQIKLELYVDIVDLIMLNTEVLANRSAEGSTPSIDTQKQRIRISHRLALLASQNVIDAYNEYRKLVFEETEQPLEYRPRNPNEVHDKRDVLIKRMRQDLLNGQI